jgi:uncharacterized membrane protein YfcA
VEPGLLGTLFALGLLGGFVSGLVGLGGSIIMVLLLYVPPALSVGVLSMKVIAGIMSVQSFCGAVFGAIGYKRHNRISFPLTVAMGGSMAVGALAGSVASAFLTADAILLVFALMAIAAAVMMLVPRHEEASECPVAAVVFSRPLAVLIGLGIGVLAGIIGQGGAFLFIPAMMFFLRIPTRIAIGTALAIGVISSTSVLLGRVGTHQIPYLMSLVVVLGVLFGAQLGSALRAACCAAYCQY